MKTTATAPILASLLASSLAAAVPPTGAPAKLVMTGARVLDPEGRRWIEGSAIVVEGDRIASIAPAASVAGLGGAARLDLAGLHAIPGLIDLHTHLLLRPYDEAPWDDQVLRESLELRTIRAVTAARATLEAGFTTIRDLGTEGAGYADVALREAIATGTIPGPRLLAAARAIVATGCYGPAGLDPRWQAPVGAQEATGPDETRRAVREQVHHGADWIKVYADYRRRRDAVPTPTFSAGELSALVEEARSAGVRVSAHAVTPEGIRRAVEAGAATIEHGTHATDEVLSLMRERGVALCPTLAATEAYARQRGWKPGTPEPDDVRAAREMLGRALRAGVTIACGSDAGVFRHGDNAREIELLAAYGMGPEAALRAATATAARVIGRERDLGRIAPGYVADIVVLRGDPLRDPSALRDPVVVIQAGRVVLDRRGR